MKKFDIITEADARTLDIGATVELAATGHVTPLARDTLAARRVTVVRAGSRDEGLPSDLAPANDIRRVAIGNDHTGVAMKRTLVGRSPPTKFAASARRCVRPKRSPDIHANTTARTY
ncbi:MAG: hypothetical protein JF632_03250 [Acidobacteria bacterium]|nr:hypothetical protein [Acidobacteriota bacterium]